MRQAHPRPNLRSPGFAIIRKDCEDCRCLLRRVLQNPTIASAYVEPLLRHVQALDKLQLSFLFWQTEHRPAMHVGLCWP